MDRITIDRALLGAAAVVWLAVIGMSVAAVVALVELGSGRATDPAPDSQTPWALYVVIGVSAAIIAASIPLLLRARRAAAEEPPQRPPGRPPVSAPRREFPVAAGYPAGEPTTEKLRVFGSERHLTPPRSPYGAGPPNEWVERVWLRFTLSMATAIGAATLAVAVATYCMGVHADGGGWAALVVAGIITVAMPVIPWRQLRQLSA